MFFCEGQGHTGHGGGSRERSRMLWLHRLFSCTASRINGLDAVGQLPLEDQRSKSQRKDARSVRDRVLFGCWRFLKKFKWSLSFWRLLLAGCQILLFCRMLLVSCRYAQVVLWWRYFILMQVHIRSLGRRWWSKLQMSPSAGWFFSFKLNLYFWAVSNVEPLL